MGSVEWGHNGDSLAICFSIWEASLHPPRKWPGPWRLYVGDALGRAAVTGVKIEADTLVQAKAAAEQIIAARLREALDRMEGNNG